MSRGDADLFNSLVERVQACRICPRMEGRTRVLGSQNGNLKSRVVFVAEAPGRLGADRCGVPLSGDQTGRNFDKLLREAHLDRSSIFITNAVLCNPRNDNGRNATPTAVEIRNCSQHLRRTIEIISPQYVVALGIKALKALSLIKPHEATLSKDVGRPILWWGRLLIPLYHPGPRARQYRSEDSQVQDFRRLGVLLAEKQE